MNFNNSFRYSFTDAVILKEELHAIGLGTVTTGEPGTEATVTLRRVEDTFVFDFVIPRGEDGNPLFLDQAMSDTSQNAVENRVIKAYFDEALAALQQELLSELETVSSDVEELADYTQTLEDVERIEMTALHVSETMLPNKLYVFPEMASLEVILGGDPKESAVQEYRFRFTSGSVATTLTLPSSVVGELTVEPNRVYEVSILDHYLVSQSWEVTS